MSEPLDWEGYPVKPRNLSDDAWFYEEPQGLLVVVKHGAITKIVNIPWRKVIAAANHHSNARRRRR